MIDKKCPFTSCKLKSRNYRYRDLLVADIKVIVETKRMVQVFLEQMYVSM